MRDASKLKDYRKKYKRYYGVEFGRDMVVHHIDGDRGNNDISNLLLLPRSLHSRYHMAKDQLENFGGIQLCTDLTAQGAMMRDMQLRCVNQFLEVCNEIDIWIIRKNSIGYTGLELR